MASRETYSADWPFKCEAEYCGETIAKHEEFGYNDDGEKVCETCWSD